MRIRKKEIIIALTFFTIGAIVNDFGNFISTFNSDKNKTSDVIMACAKNNDVQQALYSNCHSQKMEILTCVSDNKCNSQTSLKNIKRLVNENNNLLKQKTVTEENLINSVKSFYE